MRSRGERGRLAQKLFGLVVRVATFHMLDAREVYDGIYANFSLLHAPKSEMPAHLRRISVALVPGGLLHLGMKTGDGEKRDAIGRFYAYYTESELEGLLADAGLEIETRNYGEDMGLDGMMAPWIILTARKPE